MYKVALDAGHGLKTSGKRCLKSLDPQETREFALNNRIYKHVAAMLGAYEEIRFFPVHDVTGASDVPLYNRTKKANEICADIYISIHHNAGLNGRHGGGAVVYSHPNASKKAVTLRDSLYKNFIAETGLKGNRSAGCCSANFHVLRETNMPAVLIECGFMDSPEDVTVILSSKFARQAADAIVKTILQYFNIKELKTEEEKEMESNIFNTLESVPAYGRDAVKWALNKKILLGTGDGKLGLSQQDLKAIIFLYRYHKAK